jgi:biotin transport system substrate-specific component
MMKNPASESKPHRILGRPAIRQLVLIGLFLALFMVASNVIPAVQLVPGVPVTLQVLVVLLAGALLGIPGVLVFLGMLFVMTLVGIPMMSGFRSGAAVLIGPTAGYIWGWIPLGVAAGIFSRLKIRKDWPSVTAFLCLALAGILADYACGAAWMVHGTGASFFGAFGSVLLAFLPFDLGKAVLAWFIVRRVRAAVSVVML